MTADRPTPEEAARRAINPYYVLPNEPSELGATAEEASHWEGVYAELLQFKERLVAEVEATLPGMSADARADAETDHVLLSEQASRYRTRLKLWQRAADEYRGPRSAG